MWSKTPNTTSYSAPLGHPSPTYTMLVMQHILHTQVYNGIPFLAIHSSSSLDYVVNHVKGANHAFSPPGGRIGTYNCTLGVAPCVEKRNYLKVTVNSLKQVFAPVTGPSFFNFLAASSSETCMLRTPRLLAFVVKESEFRLNDQLHNMGEVVGAPKLVLNNLVPENDSRIMAKQRVGSSSRNTTSLHCWLLLVMPYRSSQSPTGLRTKGKSI